MTSKVYIVQAIDDMALGAVFATKAAADAYVRENQPDPNRVEVMDLVGGTVTVSKSKTTKATSTKTTGTKKASKANDSSEGEDNQDLTVPKPTKNALKDEALAESAGAQTLSAISKRCTLVVIGKKPGDKKLEKIQELQIDTTSEADFLRMVKEGAAVGFKRASEDEDDDEEEVLKPTKKAKVSK
ncbi:hypothetical protein IWZ01DRAFT_539170 [Phyllosticta capitalensis]